MKKVQIVILILCTFGSSGVLYGLYFFSDLNRELVRADFNRKYAPGYLEKISEIDLGVNSYYIAGFGRDRAYFGNFASPFHWLESSSSLSDTTGRWTDVGLDSVIADKRYRFVVDSPNFYVTHGVMPIILKGDFSTREARSVMTDSGYYFTQATLIGKDRFALRCYNIDKKGYELALKTKDTLEFREDLLQESGEGLFSLDGLMAYDRVTKGLVYMHYYKNELLVADSNLELKSRLHTIDSFRTVHIGVSHVNDNQAMMNRPPLLVNRYFAVNNGLIYVESNIIGQNEDMEFFLMDTVVDVYSMSGGEYEYSFYIPRGTSGKASEFAVNNGKLYARYGAEVVAYSLTKLQPTIQ